MLEIHRLRTDKDSIIQALSKRNIDSKSQIEKILKLDSHKRNIQTKLDRNKAKLNILSKSIGEFIKEGKKEDVQITKQETVSIKNDIKDTEKELKELQEKILKEIIQLPNVPNELVVKGASESDNEIVFSSGDLMPSDGLLPHWELGEKYNLMDFDISTKTTGSGFVMLKGKGALLNRELIRFFLNENIKAGYEEYSPPFLVKELSGYCTGQIPDKEGQMYEIPVDGLYLIPTSEVPLTNIYRDILLDEHMLPIKMTAYSPCFRREAGSYGKDVRGLNRLHQFDKVEIVRIEKPNNSYAVLNEMVEHIKGLLEKLELPYRILRLCGGDLGFTSALTYDFEVYSPAQEKWLEVSSVSNFETFQSTRLKLRYKGTQKKAFLCHTLNGSALALPRILATFIENHQTKKGIRIPDKLYSYLGKSLLSND